MKRFYTSVVAAMLSLTVFAQKFATDTIRYNGDPEHFINIVILGDGYLESELNQFSTDARNITNALFKESPFGNYQRYFNVFTIKVPSNVTGAALHPDSLIDNYFGSTFGYAGIERLLVPTKTVNITNVLANNFPLYDQAFMIVNSSKYGGSGGQVPTASTHSSSGEIAIHEMGHSFTNLADEYWAGSQYAREAINMTQETNTTIVKWKNWLNNFGIGLYPHAESPAWYRPHQNCKMRFLGVPFCAVCTEGTLEKIHSLVSPVIGYFPQNTDITEFSSPLLFKVDLIHPSPNTLKSTWELNGLLLENNADSVLLEKTRLTDGLNTLTFYVEDTTQLLRIDNHSSIHLSTVSWKIENTATGIDNISDASEEIFIKLNPNPVKDHLNIDFQNETNGTCRIEITDIQGTIQASFLLNEAQKNSINLTNLPQGIYIVRFSLNDNYITTRKFIKTN
jgi:hypothetical protein